MKNLYLVPLCIFIFSAAFAQEPSFDFKGIALGSAIAVIESDSRFTCKDSQGPLADRICNLKFSEKETIAGAPIQSAMLTYYYGKLERIGISFSENHFSGVISALVEKFGATPLKTEMVQNRMGASFENRIYSWRRNNATLLARRYSSNLERSSVDYITDFASEEFIKRKKTADKKKAGDL